MEHHRKLLQLLCATSHASLLHDGRLNGVSKLRFDADKCLVWLADTDLCFRRRWDSLLVDSYELRLGRREESRLLKWCGEAHPKDWS